MANQTVYPYGTGGSLPSSIGIINDRTTGGSDKAWSAEQGKLACQDIDKNTEDLFSMFSTGINRSSYAEQVGWTIISTNLWQQVTNAQKTNYGCILIPITPGMRYRVYGNTVIALLASNSMVANSSPDFCSGYIGRIVVPTGDIYDFIAPDDAEYLYFLIRSSGNETQGYVQFSDSEVPKVGEDLALLKGGMDTINSQPYKEDTPVLDGWLLTSNGTWAYTSTANAQSCLMYPIVPGEKYRIVSGSARSAVYAILASNTMAANQPADFCSGETGRRYVPVGQTEDFTAPEDAAFCYLTRKTTGGVYDSYLAIPKQINEQLSEVGIGENVRDMFESAPERFGWLKLEQCAKIKWTPKKATIQKASSTGKFTTTEQTGVPYSSVTEYDKRIGFDVSFHTFMTAINNPYSVMYTECVRARFSQSAYGRQYYGPDNSGPFYGMVCSNYAAFGLGLVAYITSDFDRLATEGVMERIYDQSANGVKRLDVIREPGHTRIIKDVWRKDGVPTKILVIEERQPLIYENAVMTSDEFNAFIETNGGIIYRYKEMYKNIHYAPSPYVAVGDEIPQTVTYNNDICTFYGDKASFIEGELIYIHCLNLDYPQMEVYKNDTLVETITLASDSRAAKTSDNLAYAVNLSNDNLAYGKYKCRLKNGNTFSDYTYFEIINAQVTVDGDTATYFSANAIATAWYWTEYHSTDGQGMYNISPLPGTNTGTIDVSNRHVSSPLLKVLFRGEYGQVAATFMES